MKATEQISLGGYAFTVEADAVRLLESYLDKIRQCSSADVRDELSSDIEERLSELFLEKCPRGTVVDEHSVKEAIERIGVPMDDFSSESGSQSEKESDPKPEKKFFYRNLEDRVFGGVLSGTAQYFGIDVFPLRLLYGIFFALFFLGFNMRLGNIAGTMLLVYLAIWLIAPAAKTVEQKCKAEGKPLRFSEFKEQAENAKVAVEQTAQEAKTSPGLKAMGRTLAVIMGVIFTIVGMSILVVDAFSAITFNTWVINIPSLVHPAHDAYLIKTLLDDSFVMISFAVMVALLGIDFLYDGVMMIFDLKTPRWKPGLILFLLWVMSVLVLGLCIVKHIVEYYNVLEFI